MNRRESSNPKVVRNNSYEEKNMNNSDKSKKKRDINLPWWVEFLFVQLGLPDKLLIKMLRTKKKTKEIIKNEKKLFLTFLFLAAGMLYFYPIIQLAKNKLDCESNAKDYIIKNKNIRRINKKDLKMLSTNFCHGGGEIYEIQNSKN